MIKLKNLITENQSKIGKIELDMDGVLTDFPLAFKNLLFNDEKYQELIDSINPNTLRNKGYTPESWDAAAKKFRSSIPKEGDVFELFKSGSTKELGVSLGWRLIDIGRSDYWTNMDWFDGGKELVAFVKSLNIPLGVLTAGPGPGAEKGKRAWLAKNGLGNIPFEMVHSGSRKAERASPEKLLIDDNDKNIELFRKAGGMGIIHRNTKDTIEELKRYTRK